MSFNRVIFFLFSVDWECSDKFPRCLIQKWNLTKFFNIIFPSDQNQIFYFYFFLTSTFALFYFHKNIEIKNTHDLNITCERFDTCKRTETHKSRDLTRYSGSDSVDGKNLSLLSASRSKRFRLDEIKSPPICTFSSLCCFNALQCFMLNIQIFLVALKENFIFST